MSEKASSSTTKVKRLHHPTSRTKHFKRLLERSDLRRQAMATLRDTQNGTTTLQLIPTSLSHSMPLSQSPELDTNHFVDNITSPNIYLNTLINGIGPSPGEQEGGHEIGDANDSVVDLTCDTNDDVIDLTKVKTPTSRRIPSFDCLPSCRYANQSSPDVVVLHATGGGDVMFINSDTSPQKRKKKSRKNHTSISSEEKKEFTESSVKCPICLETVSQFQKNGSKLVSTICGHIFCSQCLRSTITTMHRCPTCRKKLTLKQYHQLFI